MSVFFPHGHGKGIGGMTTQNARALVGRAVVSVADGEKVGTISDAVLDLEAQAVRGLVMGGGGLFRQETPSVIPLAQVHSIGPHAVTLTDKTGLVRMEGAPYEGAPTLDALKKPVVTAGGEAIGTGDDVIFDEADGAFMALQLAPQGGFLGIGATTPVIPIEEVLQFGPDVIAVQDAAVARVRPTE
jgi:uncharacterized protein YrrD